MSEITANIASHLPVIAAQQPDTYAVIVQPKKKQAAPSFKETYTYRELDEQSNIIANGLLAAGIGKGTRVVLMVTPGLDFFAIVFALYKIEAILVAIDPGMGIKNLGKCLADSEPEVFIGNTKAHTARLLFGWGKPTLKEHILVGENVLLKPLVPHLSKIKQLNPDPEFKLGDTDANDTAAILFTSGSTGIPKGVVYSHANFNAQVEMLKKLYNIQPGDIDLATFPLFALFAPALGMTSIIPHMDFTRPGNVDPEKIVDAVNHYRCTNMFGSPALLNRVGRHYENQNVKLPSLKRVLSAGAPVSTSILKRYKNLLNEDVQIFTPYGATESLPVSSIGSNEVIGETASATEQGKGVCIGRPVEGIDIKVIEITDEPLADHEAVNELPVGKIGEICVKGPQVTRYYYNREDQTELAKIISEDGFYHRMGDTGYFDEQGRLWFCGRKSQRVELEDETLFTDCCEAIFNTHPAVFRSALVGVKMNNKTLPVICIELEQDHLHKDIKIIKQELLALAQQNELTKSIKHVMFHRRFPVDVRHNAKIGREKLAKWATEQLQ